MSEDEACDVMLSECPDVAAYWAILGKNIATPNPLVDMIEGIIEGKEDLAT